jgi:hypothetical protein
VTRDQTYPDRMAAASLSWRRHLCDMPATLDGHRAVVGGVKNPHATVTDLATGASYEWAWATVEHVLTEKRGRFTT